MGYNLYSRMHIIQKFYFYNSTITQQFFKNANLQFIFYPRRSKSPDGAIILLFSQSFLSSSSIL